MQCCPDSEETEDDEGSETSDLEEFKNINIASYGLSIPNDSKEITTNTFKKNLQVYR